eukprot:symbB.v1.2.001161.t1/scaffold60.1/size581591/1
MDCGLFTWGKRSRSPSISRGYFTCGFPPFSAEDLPTEAGMEIEFLHNRVKMAQEHLLRLEQQHSKWCDGVNGAFLSMQELCEAVLKNGTGGRAWRPPSSIGTSQDRSLVPEYSTGSFERMGGSFEMQERLSSNQLFRGALVRPTLQPFVPEVDRGTTPRCDSKLSSPKDGSEYGMMDDGRCSERSASSMRSLVEGADSLLNLKYDPPARQEIQTVQEQGESREDAAMNGSTQGVIQASEAGSSLFRQLSPRIYGNSSGGSPSSPSMYGLPTSISGMLPMTADDNMRPGAQSLRTGGELRKYLDFSAGILVTLNFFFMCWELQWEGENLGALMGLAGYRPQDLLALRGLEVVFSFLFQIELALRVYADRWDFLFQLANWFDAVLVLNSFVEMYIFFVYTLQGHQDYFLEMTFRGVATLRTIRIMRAMRLFRGLRLLLKACHAFLPTLAWSMVLLGVIMSTSGLLVGRMLQYFIAEEDEELEDRIWVWNRYGTAYRSIYTLYEITFAGNWPSNVRPILEKVSHFFVLFFVLYITIVVFAAIRVITAVFLKDTLDAAQNDADHQLAENLKKRAQYVTKLEREKVLPEVPTATVGGKTAPKSMGEKESKDLARYLDLSLSIFNKLRVLGVEMDLLDLVKKEDGSINGDRFSIHTSPNRASTGLRYARLMMNLLVWSERDERPLPEDSVPCNKLSLLDYVESIIQEGCGCHTPHAVLLAWDFYGKAFGFSPHGGHFGRAKRLASRCTSQAVGGRVEAPLFSKEVMNALECMVLDPFLNLGARVAAGKLRLCVQSSTRYDDVLNTPLKAWEWVRKRGELEIVGIRSKAVRGKNRPRLWIASTMGVTPSGDTWLKTLVELLLRMHGEDWRQDDHTGKLVSRDGKKVYQSPARMDADVSILKSTLLDNLGVSGAIGVKASEIESMRWHGAKATLVTVMQHLNISPRVVRFVGDWGSKDESMADLYLREAQLMTLSAQQDALKFLRLGGSVVGLEGQGIATNPTTQDGESLNLDETVESMAKMDEVSMKPADVAEVFFDE